MSLAFIRLRCNMQKKIIVKKDLIIFEALRVTKIWFGYLKEEKQIG